MEPLIGVFSTKSEAERAVCELLDHNVPQDAIICLTDPDQERISCARELGKFVGAFVGFGGGFSIGILACFVFAHAGTWQLLVSGFGTASLLAVVCAVFGRALCNSAVSFRPKLRAIGVNGSDVDEEFVERLLQQGSSVVIVNSESAKLGTEGKVLLSTFGKCKEAEAASSAA